MFKYKKDNKYMIKMTKENTFIFYCKDKLTNIF
jgi:hypothetical protein